MKVARFIVILLAICGCLAGSVNAQAPSVADLYDNQAFLKIDHANQSLGSGFGMHFISTLKVNGVIYAYYIKLDDQQRSCSDPSQSSGGIGLATSLDGVNFTDQGYVLRAGGAGTWDCDFATFPGVWYDQGTFYLVYEGKGRGSPGDIGLATSANGRDFTKSGVILAHNSSGWEMVNIGTPSLYKENGTWYLFYHGYNTSAGLVQIGVATGASLNSLAKHPANPLIRTSAGTWQSGTAGRRDIKKIGSTYYMVYEGSELPPYDKSKWSSGIASSTDLINWSQFRQNAILPQTSASFGNDGPAFLDLDSGSYVYYRSLYAGTGRALIATELFGGLSQQWSMTSANIGHVIGRLEADGGWSASVLDGRNYLQFGPYAPAPARENVAVWKVMLDNVSADDGAVLQVEVVDASAGGEIIARREIRRRTFKQAFRYEYISLPFMLEQARVGHLLELRVLVNGISYVKVQVVGFG